MTKSFDQIIKETRWKFGDERHIRIVNKIGELNALKRSLKNSKKEARGIASTEKKIAEMEGRIIAELEYAKTL